MDLFTEQIQIGDKFATKPCWSHTKKPEIYSVTKLNKDSYLFRGFSLQEVVVMKEHLNDLFDPI